MDANDGQQAAGSLASQSLPGYSFFEAKRKHTLAAATKTRELAQDSKRTGTAPKPTPKKLLDTCLQEVLPGVFLGSKEAEVNLPILRKHAITHILQVAFEVLPTHEALGCFKYKHVPVYDMESEDLVSNLESSFAFINDALESGHKVLCHCLAGNSRSASVLLAFLMWRKRMSFNKALAQLKAIRPSVNPNAGFRLQLEWFEEAGCPNPLTGWQGWDMETFLQRHSSCHRRCQDKFRQQRKAHQRRLQEKREQHVVGNEVHPLPHQHHPYHVGDEAHPLARQHHTHQHQHQLQPLTQHQPQMIQQQQLQQIQQNLPHQDIPLASPPTSASPSGTPPTTPTFPRTPLSTHHHLHKQSTVPRTPPSTQHRLHKQSTVPRTTPHPPRPNVLPHSASSPPSAHTPPHPSPFTLASPTQPPATTTAAAAATVSQHDKSTTPQHVSHALTNTPTTTTAGTGQHSTAPTPPHPNSTPTHTPFTAAAPAPFAPTPTSANPPYDFPQPVHTSQPVIPDSEGALSSSSTGEHKGASLRPVRASLGGSGLGFGESGGPNPDSPVPDSEGDSSGCEHDGLSPAPVRPSPAALFNPASPSASPRCSGSLDTAHHMQRDQAASPSRIFSRLGMPAGRAHPNTTAPPYADLHGSGSTPMDLAHAFSTQAGLTQTVSTPTHLQRRATYDVCMSSRKDPTQQEGSLWGHPWHSYNHHHHHQQQHQQQQPHHQMQHHQKQQQQQQRQHGHLQSPAASPWHAHQRTPTVPHPQPLHPTPAPPSPTDPDSLSFSIRSNTNFMPHPTSHQHRSRSPTPCPYISPQLSPTHPFPPNDAPLTASAPSAHLTSAPQPTLSTEPGHPTNSAASSPGVWGSYGCTSPLAHNMGSNVNPSAVAAAPAQPPPPPPPAAPPAAERGVPHQSSGAAGSMHSLTSRWSVTSSVPVGHTRAAGLSAGSTHTTGVNGAGADTGDMHTTGGTDSVAGAAGAACSGTAGLTDGAGLGQGFDPPAGLPAMRTPVGSADGTGRGMEFHTPDTHHRNALRLLLRGKPSLKLATPGSPSSPHLDATPSKVEEQHHSSPSPFHRAPAVSLPAPVHKVPSSSATSLVPLHQAPPHATTTESNHGPGMHECPSSSSRSPFSGFSPQRSPRGQHSPKSHEAPPAPQQPFLGPQHTAAGLHGVHGSGQHVVQYGSSVQPHMLSSKHLFSSAPAPPPPPQQQQQRQQQKQQQKHAQGSSTRPGVPALLPKSLSFSGAARAPHPPRSQPLASLFLAGTVHEEGALAVPEPRGSVLAHTTPSLVQGTHDHHQQQQQQGHASTGQLPFLEASFAASAGGGSASSSVGGAAEFLEGGFLLGSDAGTDGGGGVSGGIGGSSDGVSGGEEVGAAAAPNFFSDGNILRRNARWSTGGQQPQQSLPVPAKARPERQLTLGNSLEPLGSIDASINLALQSWEQQQQEHHHHHHHPHHHQQQHGAAAARATTLPHHQSSSSTSISSGSLCLSSHGHAQTSQSLTQPNQGGEPSCETSALTQGSREHTHSQLGASHPSWGSGHHSSDRCASADVHLGSDHRASGWQGSESHRWPGPGGCLAHKSSGATTSSQGSGAPGLDHRASDRRASSDRQGSVSRGQPGLAESLGRGSSGATTSSQGSGMLLGWEGVEPNLVSRERGDEWGGGGGGGGARTGSAGCSPDGVRASVAATAPAAAAAAQKEQPTTQSSWPHLSPSCFLLAPEQPPQHAQHSLTTAQHGNTAQHSPTHAGHAPPPPFLNTTPFGWASARTPSLSAPLARTLTATSSSTAHPMTSGSTAYIPTTTNTTTTTTTSSTINAINATITSPNTSSRPAPPPPHRSLPSPTPTPTTQTSYHPNPKLHTASTTHTPRSVFGSAPAPTPADSCNPTTTHPTSTPPSPSTTTTLTHTPSALPTLSVAHTGNTPHAPRSIKGTPTTPPSNTTRAPPVPYHATPSLPAALTPATTTTTTGASPSMPAPTNIPTPSSTLAATAAAATPPPAGGQLPARAQPVRSLGSRSSQRERASLDGCGSPPAHAQMRAAVKHRSSWGGHWSSSGLCDEGTHNTLARVHASPSTSALSHMAAHSARSTHSVRSTHSSASQQLSLTDCVLLSMGHSMSEDGSEHQNQTRQNENPAQLPQAQRQQQELLVPQQRSLQHSLSLQRQQQQHEPHAPQQQPLYHQRSLQHSLSLQRQQQQQQMQEQHARTTSADGSWAAVPHTQASPSNNHTQLAAGVDVAASSSGWPFAPQLMPCAEASGEASSVGGGSVGERDVCVGGHRGSGSRDNSGSGICGAGAAVSPWRWGRHWRGK